jgi:CO/xanthine dehydrogenase FAD-binding subunit
MRSQLRWMKRYRFLQAVAGQCLPAAPMFIPHLAKTRSHKPLLDVSRIEALRGITHGPDGAIRIGALTTWTGIVGAGPAARL